MQDIISAIEKEQEYISYRMKNELPYNWSDAVKEFGFNDINEFQLKKQQFLLTQQSFNIVNKLLPEGIQELFKTMTSGVTTLLLVDWEDTYVACGDTGLQEYNKAYCEEHDIQVFPLHAPGGTIVGSKGDFSFGICVPIELNMTSEVVLLAVAGILQKYSSKTIRVHHNDITADNKKICGSTIYKNEKVFTIIMHFSFTDLSELIANICTTSKEGKLVGYVDFMSREQLKEEIVRWLNPQY